MAPRSSVVSSAIDRVLMKMKKRRLNASRGVARELKTVLIHKCDSLYETCHYIPVDQRVTGLLKH